MLAVTRLSSVALYVYIATHNVSLQDKNAHKMFGNLLCRFPSVCCPKAVAMNVQFSHAVYCVSVERKAHSVFINFKVWRRNDPMCRWVRTANYEVPFCWSFSVLCSVSEPNISLSTRFSTRCLSDGQPGLSTHDRLKYVNDSLITKFVSVAATSVQSEDCWSRISRICAMVLNYSVKL